MKMGLKLVSIALLCLAGTEGVFAEPFSRGREGREEMRAARQPRTAQQEERQQPQADGRRAAPVAAPVFPSFSGGFGELGQGGNITRPHDQVRKMGGRLTVEERRALRRQINDAGHDIYAPKK